MSPRGTPQKDQRTPEEEELAIEHEQKQLPKTTVRLLCGFPTVASGTETNPSSTQIISTERLQAAGIKGGAPHARVPKTDNSSNEMCVHLCVYACE